MSTGGDGMAEASDTYAILYQNLVDAGCDEQTIENCMILYKKDRKQMIPLLLKRKESLLDTVHDSHKQIDCLDYLIYKLKKNSI